MVMESCHRINLGLKDGFYCPIDDSFQAPPDLYLHFLGKSWKSYQLQPHNQDMDNP
jgi:hypothetical protein